MAIQGPWWFGEFFERNREKYFSSRTNDRSLEALVGHVLQYGTWTLGKWLKWRAVCDDFRNWVVLTAA